MGNTEITHNGSNRPTVELGIELVVEMLLFLYPYGAEQMNLPHNFWLGLGCWIIGAAIAIRMFWIFPIWKDRFSRLEKGLIAFILVVFFVLLFYRPVEAAYKKRNGVLTTQATPDLQPIIPSATPVSVTPVLTTYKTKPQIQGSAPLSSVPVKTPLPLSTPVIGGRGNLQQEQSCETGSLCNQNSVVNAPQTVNNFGPPPPHISSQSETIMPPIPPFVTPATEAERQILASQYNASLGLEKFTPYAPTWNPGLAVSFQVSSTFSNPEFVWHCDQPCFLSSVSTAGTSGNGNTWRTSGLPPILPHSLTVIYTFRSNDPKFPVTHVDIKPYIEPTQP